MTKTTECREKQGICPFLPLNSRYLSPPWEPQTPFSSSGTQDFLSTCLGIYSLNFMANRWGNKGLDRQIQRYAPLSLRIDPKCVFRRSWRTKKSWFGLSFSSVSGFMGEVLNILLRSWVAFLEVGWSVWEQFGTGFSNHHFPNQSPLTSLLDEQEKSAMLNTRCGTGCLDWPWPGRWLLVVRGHWKLNVSPVVCSSGPCSGLPSENPSTCLYQLNNLGSSKSSFSICQTCQRNCVRTDTSKIPPQVLATVCDYFSITVFSCQSYHSVCSHSEFGARGVGNRGIITTSIVQSKRPRLVQVSELLSFARGEARTYPEIF